MRGNRRQKALNTDLKCWHFQDDCNLGATSVFLLRVKQFKTPLCTFPWTPHPPCPRQYSACYCLGHWHPKMFTLCYCEGNETTSGKMIEWMGGALEATSASSYCSKQFSSGSNLHVPFTCTTCLWSTGPPSLDGVLRNIYYDANTC